MLAPKIYSHKQGKKRVSFFLMNNKTKAKKLVSVLKDIGFDVKGILPESSTNGYKYTVKAVQDAPYAK